MTQILDIVGGNLPKETSFTVERPSGDLVIGGKVNLLDLSGKKVGDTLVVSGVNMTVRDRSQIFEDGVREELGLSSDVSNLLRKAPQDRIVYTTMSTEEYADFKNTTGAVVLVKGGDAFGRGGWTNKAIIQDIADRAAIKLVFNIYEHWIKQYEIPPTQSYVDAIMGLVAIFKPRAWFLNNTLYLLQPTERAAWTGAATFTSKVQSATVRDSLIPKPYKLILTGGQGPFDPTKYQGVAFLGSRGGTVKVGRRSYNWRDWGQDRTDEIEVSQTKFDTELAQVTITKTNTRQIYGIDIFGNDAYMREEIIESRVQQMHNVGAGFVLSEQEHTFNDYSHEHWYWAQPRLERTIRAVKKKSPALYRGGVPFVYDDTKYQEILLTSTDSFKFEDKEAVVFEETIYSYDDKKGGILKHKMVRRRADCISEATAPTSADGDLRKWSELDAARNDSEVFVDDVNYLLQNPPSNESIYFFPQGIVYEEHTHYRQISKKYYQMTKTTMTLDPNYQNQGFAGYVVRQETSKVPAGKVPSSRIEPRKMTVYAEKIIGGDAPNVEISDPNIIDWKQAQDILDELAFQFESGTKRYTNIELPGEIPLDVGWSVKMDIQHVPTGIRLSGSGTGFISSYTRTKDAGSGTAKTTVTVEEFV